MKLIVPVKPEVKDFFIKNSDILGKEPCQIRKNSRIGILVTTVFAHNPPELLSDIEFFPKDVSLEELPKFPENEIILELSFKIPHQFVTDERLILLSKFFELLMDVYALAWMRGRMDYLPSENSAATLFHRKHKINDGHIKSDAFRQLLRRNKTI
ncbi:hypothetical protein [Flectobacillus major]|uniref:hypothetical protein n=1 Tax=Flectobacillus major TaxID=103 RepID=UPI00041F7EB1|nr:hypothetical protein [Flectobacillus major]